VLIDSSIADQANYNTIQNEKSFDAVSHYSNFLNRSNLLKAQSQSSNKNLSQKIKMLNLSESMQNRILSPKTNYRFVSYAGGLTSKNKTDNKGNSSCKSIDIRSRTPKYKKFTREVKKSPSIEKIKYNSILNKDKSYNNLNTSKGSISGYLDQRHNDTVEKINKMKYEKLVEETRELRSTPKLSKTSMKIIDRLVDIKQNNVFDRLSSTKYQVS
jgi:hypothetical protein